MFAVVFIRLGALTAAIFGLLQQLTEAQSWIIVALAVALTQVIKWVVQALHKKSLSKRWVTAIAFVASVILGFIFMKPEMPAFDASDPFGYVQALFAAVDQVMLWAMLVYNVLFFELLDKLGGFVQSKTGAKVAPD